MSNKNLYAGVDCSNKVVRGVEKTVLSGTDRKEMSPKDKPVKTQEGPKKRYVCLNKLRSVRYGSYFVK